MSQALAKALANPFQALAKPNFMPFWSKTDPFSPDLDFSSQNPSQIPSQISCVTFWAISPCNHSESDYS